MSSYLDIYLVIFLLPLKNIYYFYNKNISQWNSGRHRGFNVIRVLFFRRRPFFKCKLICFYCGLYFTSDYSVIFFFVIIWIYLSHKVEETSEIQIYTMRIDNKINTSQHGSRGAAISRLRLSAFQFL